MQPWNFQPDVFSFRTKGHTHQEKLSCTKKQHKYNNTKQKTEITTAKSFGAFSKSQKSEKGDLQKKWNLAQLVSHYSMTSKSNLFKNRLQKLCNVSATKIYFLFYDIENLQ